MSVLHTVSFKEFGSLVCLWQDVKLRKTQLEVRSLNVTWRRDLCCHRVIVFWKCVKLLAEQLWQIWRRYVFFRYLRKTLGGGRITAPGRARVKFGGTKELLETRKTPKITCLEAIKKITPIDRFGDYTCHFVSLWDIILMSLPGSAIAPCHLCS